MSHVPLTVNVCKVPDISSVAVLRIITAPTSCPEVVPVMEVLTVPPLAKSCVSRLLLSIIKVPLVEPCDSVSR